jgi:hypothetical protein
MASFPDPGGDFLKDEFRYRVWRETRLQACPQSADQIHVKIDGLLGMTAAQKMAITRVCKNANMVIYQCRDPFVDRAAIVAFASQFGLSRIDHHLCANADGVSELSVASEGIRTEYVPYSSRSLSWHTDGYYNKKERQINAVVLHCAQQAETGGENALLDPDIAYIRLRDEDPRFITAFEHPACMTIPANVTADQEIRAAVTGPVFSYDAKHKIHMRYSARKKNIQWRDDPATTDARACLSEILDEKKGPVIRHRLRPGEGLLSNNVLHNRTKFSDGTGDETGDETGDGMDTHRFLYRARFFDRIES